MKKNPSFVISTKFVLLSFLAVAMMSMATSCAARAHANKHSTGAGLSTPIGSLGGGVRY